MVTDPDGVPRCLSERQACAGCRTLLPHHVYGGAESWNLRDRHMFDTLWQLLEVKGKQSKAVVWP